MTALRRIVVTWLATAQGGAEKSSVELCSTISRRYQIDVDLIVWHYGDHDSLSLDTNEPAGTTHCFEAADYRRALTAALSGATVLFSNHRTYATDLWLAERHEVPTAVIFRQTPMFNEALRTLPSDDATELVYRRGDELDWELLQSAAALVGVSDFGARGIARFAANHPKVVRIFNGVRMPGANEKPIANQRVRRFLIVARLIDWKAIDFGLEAFARLWQVHPDARLQIAGDGEEEQHLRLLAKRLQIDEQVEFLGFVNDIRQVYFDNDCLLHPSGIESFGRVVVEASLCGRLVVVPQTAGTGELVVNEHTGLTFDPNDLDDCVRALRSACALEAADYERLTDASKQRSAAMFNTDRLADEYVGLANSLIRPAGKAS